MASRMERYHSEIANSKKRVERNKTLYDQGSEQNYSNIGGVLVTGKKNTVDIDKLKETIKKYEEDSTNRKQLVKKNIEIDIDINKNYNHEEIERHDIKELLEEAKKEKEDDEVDKYRTLKKEEYALLMKIKEKNNKFNKQATDNEIKEELMNTMQLSKKELDELEQNGGIDIFGELEDNSKNDKTGKSIQELIEEAKKEKEEEDLFDRTEDLDGSFNTDSIKLTEKDFDKTEEIMDVITNKKIAISKKTLYVLLGLIIIIAFLCIIYFIL